MFISIHYKVIWVIFLMIIMSSIHLFPQLVNKFFRTERERHSDRDTERDRERQRPNDYSYQTQTILKARFNTKTSGNAVLNANKVLFPQFCQNKTQNWKLEEKNLKTLVRTYLHAFLSFKLLGNFDCILEIVVKIISCSIDFIAVCYLFNSQFSLDSLLNFSDIWLFVCCVSQAQKRRT